ncbi:30S ribosomal protein S14 [Neochlamydia sp. EPS4]|jgi:small subunit ribosomal protein S14|uniref:30S ribosomal protein S14 n=1 Tax=unclassified Neochlamydia TaxID=2643326 RepID=UPI0005804E22|nr:MULTISPECIES: 30S ribosomal protein S14 [unclassified Neochlamydia]KIC74776.1 30S ribosomal protein S14 [Neochlamydia sp. EPS4]KIC74966.1 30S ribosomal protein S14 [Neochlamydia sp. TUME1]MBS4165525.1 30S ribosomal protein S14 [Neochlamydia sp. AcF65]MBS4170804.1 30S ribosomal protein S14 [Neochlamydia sp. AcF95]NGY95738.1 30S ribosomal protein S14 [Neochlamydia sp. AcF84]
MAKRSSIEKAKRREKVVKLKWEKRQALKKTAADINISEEERHEARVALNKMPRDSSPTRLRNRCLLTGRARGFIRQFKLSRLTFREMALHGLIPGVTKSSW